MKGENENKREREKDWNNSANVIWTIKQHLLSEYNVITVFYI